MFRCLPFRKSGLKTGCNNVVRTTIFLVTVYNFERDIVDFVYNCVKKCPITLAENEYKDYIDNIIFFSLLDSDWLKSVPINP